MIEEELPDELENDLDDIEPVGDESQLYEHFRVVVDKGQAMVRVDKYLFERIVNASRNRIQKAAEGGFVMANGKPVKSSYKVKPLDVITVMMDRPRYENEIIPENIITKEQFVKFVENSVKFEELMMMYRCAIREVQTKLEILNDEFKTKRQRNPIDSIRSRIKSPLSIYEKLKRRNYPVSIQSIADNLNDVAGIRVVCPFISDIYDVARMLISQDDVEVMEVKDYIKNPKPNGYRSLHYVVIIPIFLSSGKEYMKVEVQIRTIAMNFWASLEHQMHYKQFDNDDMPEIVKQLTECAENIYQTDVRMQEIREDIHKFNE